MSTITFLRPVDQPIGKQRLLKELQLCLSNSEYTHFCFAVAFAKSGPLYRLSSSLEAWKSAGKTIEGIFGIDHLGTSYQALEYALDTFDRVFITHNPSNLQITFHPKLYLFYGDTSATCFYGSHNLTVGGTETNYEGGVKIELRRPDDESSFMEALDCWKSLLPGNEVSTLALDKSLLAKLMDEGWVFDENKTQPRTLKPSASSSPTTSPSISFPRMYVKPPSPLPPLKTKKRKKSLPGSTTVTNRSPIKMVGQTFVIEIIPHENGELHLSKIAINQNPRFFDFPFTGATTPKKPGNPSYPQREPDFNVDVNIYDINGLLIARKVFFALNTVFYKENGEIRITFPAELAREIPPYSIMVMTKNPVDSQLDYNIDIYFPGSKQYQDYAAVCNQTLPKGTLPRARKMGWL